MLILVTFLLGICKVYSLSQNCTNEIGQMVFSQLIPGIPERYHLMFQYSGFETFNNLGNFDSCIQIDDAKFAVLSYSWQPAIVKTVCGPASCTEEDYYSL